MKVAENWRETFGSFSDNTKIEDGQLIDEIIKVILPGSEEKAKDEWDNGLTYNGNKHIAWFATTGGMKVEKNSGKCETFYIDDSFYDRNRSKIKWVDIKKLHSIVSETAKKKTETTVKCVIIFIFQGDYEFLGES